MNFNGKFVTGNVNDQDVNELIILIKSKENMDCLGTARLSTYLGMKTQEICAFLRKHPEIEVERRDIDPTWKTPRKGRNALYWNEDSIRDFIFIWLREKFPSSNPITSPLSQAYQLTEQKIAAPSADYIAPIDVIIELHNAVKQDPNTEAYLKLKSKFDSMNERSLQLMFSPILERFKFRYICSQIPELQSQTLTCIAKGKLRGLEQYKLTFEAFLKLIKFAHDHYTPLDDPDIQK